MNLSFYQNTQSAIRVNCLFILIKERLSWLMPFFMLYITEVWNVQLSLATLLIISNCFVIIFVNFMPHRKSENEFLRIENLEFSHTLSCTKKLFSGIWAEFYFSRNYFSYFTKSRKILVVAEDFFGYFDWKRR